MKLRHYKRNTYTICMAWVNCDTFQNKNYLRCCLARWARASKGPESEDYGYDGNSKGIVEYCSDRMNAGRAKAILRLFHEEAAQILESLRGGFEKLT